MCWSCSSTLQWVAPNGRIYDQRQTSHYATKAGVSWVSQRDALLEAGWKQQESNRKFRYVYQLDKSDKRLQDLIESKRKPYPKRADEATEGAHGDQP